MTRRSPSIALMLLVLVAALVPTPGHAQTADPPALPEPTATPQSLASVVEVFDELHELRRDLERWLADTDDLDQAAGLLDELETTKLTDLHEQITALEKETRFVDLLDADTEAHALELEVAALVDQLRSDVRRAEKDLEAVTQHRSLLVQLGEKGATDAAPTSLLDRMAKADQTLGDLELAVRQRRDRALDLLVRSMALKTETAGLRDALGDRIERVQRTTLAAASGPVWRMRPRTPEDSIRALHRSTANDIRRVREYLRANGSRIALVFAMVLAAGLMVSLLVRRRLEQSTDDGEAGELPPVLAHPLSSALLLALVAASAAAPAGPQVINRSIWALMALPAAQLAASILGRRSVLPVALITATVLLWPLRSYLAVVPIIDRVLLLLEDAAGIAAVLLVLRRDVILDRLSDGWRTPVRVLLWTEIAVLAVSFASGIVGEVGFARLLRDGALVSLGLAMVFYGIARALFRIVGDVLRGPVGAQSKMVRSHPETVLRVVHGSVIVGAVAAWGWLSLEAFQLSRPLQSAVEGLLGAGVEVGWFEVTVSEILSFVAAIAAAFVLARLVCFILDEEFLPRLHLERGVPYMISTSVRYLILLAGFALAMAALGVDLSKATLLAGAFGVGLGFGLQNVVNNFVSGLILLFERPIRVRDVVEVSGILGEVTRIGIRSSTVRTFVGSEVLVPNGDLISKEVTNWTLSSRRRLVEVLVGAAYESDPGQVIEILKRVANSHDEVLADPEPAAYLIGFGDSQLDFRLVCWVAQYGDGYRVASELRVEVAEAFAGAGIEIPFPQQDLRVKAGGESIPPGAAPPASLGQAAEEKDSG